MAVKLTAIVECPSCGTEFEGEWTDDSDTLQDMAEAPTQMQTCECGKQFEETYPGWTEWSGAG